MSKKTVVFLCISLLLTLYLVFSVSAEGKKQSQFAAQLCNALGIEVTDGNYIAPLEAKGIVPENGWNPENTLSNKEMATLLAKAMGLEQEIDEKVSNKLNQAYRNKATIIRLEGTVSVKVDNNADWVIAETGMKLSQDDSIKTGPQSWAELRVGMVGGVRVKENTELDLIELSSKTGKAENIILYLNLGEMLVDARGIDTDTSFQVRTATTVAGVRGTIYNIKVGENLTEIEDTK